MIIGWIGLILLMLAYLTLVSKYSKYFLVIDIIASLMLTIHAILINDLPFIIVNFFIACMLSIKLYQGGLK